jgi:hypothetical protein
VIGPDGCSASDPEDCTVDRGQLFNSQASTTWQDWPNGTLYPLENPQNLPIKDFGLYGDDTVALGSMQSEDGVVLPRHSIAQITSKDHFLGMFFALFRTPATERQTESLRYGTNPD